MNTRPSATAMPAESPVPTKRRLVLVLESEEDLAKLRNALNVMWITARDVRITEVSDWRRMLNQVTGARWESLVQLSCGICAAEIPPDVQAEPTAMGRPFPPLQPCCDRCNRALNLAGGPP